MIVPAGGVFMMLGWVALAVGTVQLVRPPRPAG
jgi:uncharacterized membrane protein YgdD (TMEM256/DUF423 family)